MKDILPISPLGLKPAIFIADPVALERRIDIHISRPGLLRRVPQHSIQRFHDPVHLYRDTVEGRRRQFIVVRTVVISIIRIVELRIAEDVHLALLVRREVRRHRLLEKFRQALAEAVDGDVVVVPGHLARLVIIAAVPRVFGQGQHARLDRVGEHTPGVAPNVDGDEIRAAEVVANGWELPVKWFGFDLVGHVLSVGAGAGREVEGTHSNLVAEDLLESVWVGSLGATATSGLVVTLKFIEVPYSGSVRVSEGCVNRENLVSWIIVIIIVVAHDILGVVARLDRW